jgi:dolichyldiphosphatase
MASSSGYDGEAKDVLGSRRSTVLSAVNESTKFVVSCTALGFLLINPTAETCWALLGSVVNSVNGKILKRVLNQERPDGSRKGDPGMPSSHATSLSYLSVYGAASLAHFRDAAPALGYGGQLIVSGALVLVGMWLSYLRVSTGYHTAPQVAVGYGLGSTTALAWLFVGLNYVKPALIAHPEMLRVLHSLLIIAIGWFAFSALHWVEGLVDSLKRKFYSLKSD